MSAIRAFKGIRFNGQNITKFICPPYDVISETDKKALHKLSKNNIVNVELPDAKGTKNKYQNAAFIFNDLQKKGVLVQETEPALYFYEQEFTSSGKKTFRRGFFAALKLERPGKGSVKPHEKTLSKHKEDRLKLFHEVKANISPIFGLFNDKNKTIVEICKKLSKTKPVSSAKEFKTGVINRLWKVTDRKIIDSAVKALKNQNIFIADGHHRYETAWNYSQEMKKKPGYSPQANYNYVMAFICPMEDPGLVVWPTHRVVVEPKGFEEKIEKYFKVLPKEAFKKLESRLPQPILVYKNGAYRTLTVKNPGILAGFMKDKCKAYRELGVSILHSILLDGIDPHTITYVKKDSEAVEQAKNKKILGIILPSTPVDAVKQIALAKQVMPQKSTYFYPKVVTGMVIHKLQ